MTANTMVNDNTIDEFIFQDEERDAMYQQLTPYEKKLNAFMGLQEQIFRLTEAGVSPATVFKLAILKRRQRILEKELQALINIDEDYE